MNVFRFFCLISLPHSGFRALEPQTGNSARTCYVLACPCLHLYSMHEQLINTIWAAGKAVHARDCKDISAAYLYATTPHMFSAEEHTEEAFNNVRDAVRSPLYGCDCYAYGLLAAGCVDVVVEADLKPYDYMALVPIVEEAGGVMTDWLVCPSFAWCMHLPCMHFLTFRQSTEHRHHHLHCRSAHCCAGWRNLPWLSTLLSARCIALVSCGSTDVMLQALQVCD